jgi:Leucine-rich repeat (LRR) protein
VREGLLKSRLRAVVAGLLFAVAAESCALAAACFSAPSGLVGWWAGDGNANDIAGTNNGTLQGGATASAVGMVGSAFGFDGTNGYVQIADSPVLKPTNLTVEAWVNFSNLNSARSGGAPAGSQYIVFKQNSRTSIFEGYSLEKFRVAGGDVFMFTLSSAAGQDVVLQSKTLVTTSVWYHVAGVRGSNYTELYVNGTLESRTNAPYAQDYGSVPLYFGTSAASYWDGKLRGLLDEVSLYNRALSSNEVAAVYAAGAAGKCKGASIAAQPQSQTVVAGTNALLTVTATGYGTLGYQWRFNGTNISSATSSSLTLTNVQLTNAGSYTVRVTNSLASVTSAVAVLTVWVPPLIAVQPESRTNVVGTDAGFSVAASGTPSVSYQWQFSGTAISQATGSSLTRSAVSFADAGGYRVVVTNAAGVVTSATATLTLICPAVSLAPASLPGGTAGSVYNQGLSASGGTGPYSYSLVNGSLPAGMALSGGGVLSGTPVVVGNFSVIVRATDSNGCWGTNGYTLAIGCPAVAVRPVTLPSGLVGNAYNQSLTATGGLGTYIFAVTAGTLPSGLSLSAAGAFTGAPSALGTNSFMVRATDTNGCSGSQAYSLAVTGAPPAITVQPQSRTNVIGTDADFSVIASGTPPPAYQWHFNGITIPGATGNSLARGEVTLADAGGYRVVLTNVAGAVTSAVATLTVVCPLVTIGPAVLPDAVVGSPYLHALEVTGNSGTYTMEVTAGSLPLGLSLSGSGILFGTPTAVGTNNFTVRATDTSGCSGSQVCTLAVTGAPPVILAQPQSRTNIVGTDGSFSVTASGTPGVSYQWQFNGANIPGATGAILAVTNVQVANGGSYAVVVANSAGVLTSSVAMLTVWVPPNVVISPGGLTVVEGGAASFASTASGDLPLSYQWEWNGERLLDATRTSLTFSNAQSSQTGSYRVVVTNVAGSATSQVAALTVVSLAQLAPIPDPRLKAAVGVELSKQASLLTFQDLLGLTNLTAAFQGITNLSGLQWATSLTRLVLSGNFIRDLAPLAGLQELAYLYIEGNRISDLSPLATLTNLTLLNAGLNLIASPSSLSNLTALSGLWLYNNSISNLSFLTPLEQLNSLALDNNGISDLSPLAVLTNLSTLGLGGNPIENHSILGGLTNLTDLSLADGSLRDLAVLQPLTKLTSLALRNNRISDLSPLGGCSSLRHLELQGNRLSNYSAALAQCTNLTELQLGGCAISDLSFARNLPQLSFLALDSNSISNLLPLAAATNLTYLVLSANPIADYFPLSNLVKLANLELRGNAISNAGFLSTLRMLRYLDLSYNNITDLSPLGGLTNLGGLVASSNPIANYGSVPGMLNLEGLWLHNNAISNVTFLQGLRQLRSLGLDNNRVSDLSPLLTLTNLDYLGLGWNPATNFPVLASLSNLSGLGLAGNSITNLEFVQGLTSIRMLDLRSDPLLRTLSALDGLTNLTCLSGDYNWFTDIAGLTKSPLLSKASLVHSRLDTLSNALGVIQSLQNRGVEVAYLPTNQAPRIGIIPRWTIATNIASSLTFLVVDDETPTEHLLVTVSSSNPGLISDASILLSGTNGVRVLTLTPVASQPNPSNTASITLSVTDQAGLTANATMLVKVVSPAEVQIADPNLEATIRVALGKPIGSLANVDLLGLRELNAFNANITNLSGLEAAANLEVLNVGYNKIRDLTPLAGLANLQHLTFKQNLAANILPINNLSRLVMVDMSLNLLDLSDNSPSMAVVNHLLGQAAVVTSWPQRELAVTDLTPTWVMLSNAVSVLPFGIYDNGPDNDPPFVWATSSNPSVIPSSNLVVNASPPFGWRLTLVANNSATGMTTVTIYATNSAGLSASDSSVLMVTEPHPLGAGWGTGTAQAWNTWGNALWFIETNVTHSGAATAQSGAMGHSQESWLQTTVLGPGSLSFWWKASSETNYDWLELYVAGVLQPNRISGEVNWQQRSFYLGPGTWSVAWRYVKDESESAGLDAAWVADVNFGVTGLWLEPSGVPTNGQFHFILHGSPGNVYQLQAASNLITWSSVGTILVPLSNASGAVPCTDTIPTNWPRRFYRALQQ